MGNKVSNARQGSEEFQGSKFGISISIPGNILPTYFPSIFSKASRSEVKTFKNVNELHVKQDNSKDTKSNPSKTQQKYNIDAKPRKDSIPLMDARNSIDLVQAGKCLSYEAVPKTDGGNFGFQSKLGRATWDCNAKIQEDKGGSSRRPFVDVTHRPRAPKTGRSRLNITCDELSAEQSLQILSCNFTPEHFQEKFSATRGTIVSDQIVRSPKSNKPKNESLRLRLLKQEMHGVPGNRGSGIFYEPRKFSLVGNVSTGLEVSGSVGLKKGGLNPYDRSQRSQSVDCSAQIDSNDFVGLNDPSGSPFDFMAHLPIDEIDKKMEMLEKSFNQSLQETNSCSQTRVKMSPSRLSSATHLDTGNFENRHSSMSTTYHSTPNEKNHPFKGKFVEESSVFPEKKSRRISRLSIDRLAKVL
mmetsp:Transcript_1450/g.2068  ORF Transcript_1450/g.2068 Transcript_1450/m.2068 type:complete len:413 (+) Transcript_1450:166-1404(+)|eukprot:CAMPEP_0196583976 /NCGR_PEP_ID=MMETSP1081-20130531/45366_1 /TAXON_ID=36882 /ORGANISM="Pyramimonas amylifera, Strain CCMP720" /LENGTH=412 /DNA_ID=CAMNT_0041905025 /DNA_START=146 /DNA_END=1384 /DNA_ORIENTATION=+